MRLHDAQLDAKLEHQMRFRDIFVPVTLAGSLAAILWGLDHSAILTLNPWTSVMQRQIGLIGLAAVCSTGLAVLVQRLWHFRLEVSLAVLVASALVAAFGPMPTIVVGLFLLSSAVIGMSLSTRVSGTAKLPLVFATALGAAIYAIIFTLISPIPINVFPLHACLLAAPLVIVSLTPLGRRSLIARLDALRQGARRVEKNSAAYISGLTVFLFVALLQAFIAALPERYWDAMVMHLYIPSYEAANRTWSYDPILYAFAFMPAAVDWLYGHFFILQGEMACKLFDYSTLILTCALLYVIVLRVAARDVAIWIVVLFASMPIAFLESSTLFIENPLTLWLTAAVGVLLLSGLRQDLRHAIAALIFLTAASMSKLHGAVAAAIIGPTMLCLFLRQRRPAREVIFLLTMCAALGAIALFPYIFAWLKTGDPLFPYYNAIFKSPFFPTISFHDTRWEGQFSWRLLYDATFASNRYLEANVGALGLTLILLLPLAVVAMIARPNEIGVVSLLLAIAVMLAIGWEIQYLRYFYPIFPILFVPAACGVMLLIQRVPKRAVTFAVLAAVAGFNIYKFPSAGWLLSNVDLAADFDPEKRQALVLTTVPERLANVEINQLAGPSARVLYTGNPFGALLQGTALYTDWYNEQLAGAMAKLATAEQVRALLLQWDVTHVVYALDGKKPGQDVVDAYLAKNYRPIARFGHLVVYDLRASSPSPSDITQ